MCCEAQSLNHGHADLLKNIAALCDMESHAYQGMRMRGVSPDISVVFTDTVYSAAFWTALTLGMEACS